MDLTSLTERFIRYTRFNTQSDPDAGSFPSTDSQKKFGRLLADELKELGIDEVRLDQFGYVTATIPSNTDKIVPAVLFCSHLDTSPDCEAVNITPVIHRNYQGGDIVLPSDPPRILSPKDHPELLDKLGKDIITADGNTLLSADNKAGIAELVEVARLLMMDPGIKHGKLVLLFVPDEEIGKDILNLDVKSLGADYGYTVDGHSPGTINQETFSVAKVNLAIYGSPIHTGAGRGLMENAVKIASEVIHRLPPAAGPESSHGRQGFIHVASMEGKIGSSRIIFQVRAFEENELISLTAAIKRTAADVLRNFRRSSFSFSVERTDRNILETLREYPFITDFAAEAVRRAGLDPKIEPLRGVTTGAGLCFKGLPAANLFTGQQANHSKSEWICIQDMETAVETILHLCEIWEEKGDSCKVHR
jgi:tripeptide aminopeptidase